MDLLNFNQLIGLITLFKENINIEKKTLRLFKTVPKSINIYIYIFTYIY